jgi:AraC-like DNA-binding protein
MSETIELGVLYTEYSRLRSSTRIASLWSYETCARKRNRRSIALAADGSHEYWLDRSDPLLNRILPGTGVSFVINFGDLWATSRSLATPGFLPRVCVVGPVTQAQTLQVGRSVHAVGAGLQSPLRPLVFGLPTSELVDRIVPLHDLWAHSEVERLLESLSRLEAGRSALALKHELMTRISRVSSPDTLGQTSTRLIILQAGRVSIEDIARAHGLSRREFGRRFCAAAGLPPKLFARITRFQMRVHTLLSTDVSQWASVSSAVGFYDQAHMINEFRTFAGSPPTLFFRPYGSHLHPETIQLRGRPSEWLSGPELARSECLFGSR